MEDEICVVNGIGVAFQHYPSAAVFCEVYVRTGLAFVVPEIATQNIIKRIDVVKGTYINYVIAGTKVGNVILVVSVYRAENKCVISQTTNKQIRPKAAYKLVITAVTP